MRGWTIPRRPRPAAQAPEGGQAAPGRRPPGPARRQRRLRGLPPPRADEERAAVVLVGAAALFVVLVVAYELGHDGRSPIREVRRPAALVRSRTGPRHEHPTVRGPWIAVGPAACRVGDHAITASPDVAKRELLETDRQAAALAIEVLDSLGPDTPASPDVMHVQRAARRADVAVDRESCAWTWAGVRQAIRAVDDDGVLEHAAVGDDPPARLTRATDLDRRLAVARRHR